MEKDKERGHGAQPELFENYLPPACDIRISDVSNKVLKESQSAKGSAARASDEAPMLQEIKYQLTSLQSSHQTTNEPKSTSTRWPSCNLKFKLVNWLKIKLSCSPKILKKTSKS